jgi:hypothetical protein
LKNFLFILAFISSACFGQGRKVAVFDPATNSYVYVYVFETLNPPSPTYITGTIPFNKLTGSDIVIPESQVTNLTSDLALKAPLASPTFTGTVTLPSSTVTNAMLAGSIAYSKLSLTGAVLNADLAGSITASKLVGSDITLSESQVTNLTTDLAAKAPLASPTFTGTVTLPNSTVTNAMLAGSIAYSKLSLTGAILNADLAGSIAYSKLALTGAILNADLAGSIAYSKLSLAGAITNSDLAGSIAESKITNLVTDLAAKEGISAAATSATTGTMTTTMTSATQTVFTITPTGACTFNASGGAIGARMTFIITTSGTSAFVLTWGTNFKSTATLSTGTVTAKVFCVSFVCKD